MPESLHIETPSAPLALALIERLNGFHAEVVPCGDERFQVRVDLEGRSGADRALLDSLDRVERWLESSDLDLAEVHLNGRSYRLERRDGKPPIRTHAEVDGLVFRMRTVPLGAGVQVLSAEGELDLHTTEQLEEALGVDRSFPCDSRPDGSAVRRLDGSGDDRRLDEEMRAQQQGSDPGRR